MDSKMLSLWKRYISLVTIVLVLISNISYGKALLTVDDFLSEPVIYDAEFSPDGRYLATIVNHENSRLLIIRDFETEGHPVTGTMTHKFIRPNTVSWANNERLLVGLLVPLNISMG